jgi:hypothetical protein
MGVFSMVSVRYFNKKMFNVQDTVSISISCQKTETNPVTKIPEICYPDKRTSKENIYMKDDF